MPCILSNEISKDKLQETVARIRTCDICKHAFWKGEECPNHSKYGLKINVYDEINIETFVKYSEYYSTGFKLKRRHKLVEKKREDKMCKVCGENSGKRQCCSDLCSVRLLSSWYGKTGEKCYMSIEDAQIRLDTKNKKRS